MQARIIVQQTNSMRPLTGMVTVVTTFAALGTVAALWENPFFVRMTPAGAWEIGLLGFLSLLGGGRRNAAYIASKGAIVSLVKTAAFELAPDNIRVNAVAPGAIDTPMLNRSLSRAEDPAAAREYSRNRHALNRFGRPEEIANGVVYLLTDEASFNTGSVLTIDGGWRAA